MDYLGDPKCHHTDSYKRDADRDFIQMHREGAAKMEVEIGVMSSQVQELRGRHQKLEEARNRLASRALRGSVALPMP